MADPRGPVVVLDIETWPGPPPLEVVEHLANDDLTAASVKAYLDGAVDTARALPLFMGVKVGDEAPYVLRWVDVDRRTATVPTFDELDRLADDLRSARAIVGHNVSFDLGVARRALYLSNVKKRLPIKEAPWKAGRVVCTLELFNALFDGGERTKKGRSLAACCNAVGVPYTKRIHGGLVPEAFLRTLSHSPGLRDSGWRDLAAAEAMVVEDVLACENLYHTLQEL